MSRVKTIGRAASLGLAVLLVAGFVAYRGGYLNWFISGGAEEPKPAMLGGTKSTFMFVGQSVLPSQVPAEPTPGQGTAPEVAPPPREVGVDQ